MKKYLIILILALPIFIWQGVRGQEYNKLIQENLTWDVLSANGSVNPFCDYVGGYRQFIWGDTTIQGNDYKIVNGIMIASTESGPFCPPFHISNDTVFKIGFIREDTIARKVFVYDIDYGDALLYDFSLSVGDTLFSYINFCDNLIIDSIGTITLFNLENRNIFYLNNGEFYIEGIGGSQGLKNPLCQGIGFWNESFCVLKDGDAIFNFSDQFVNCFQVLTIEKFQNIQDVIIYPNPANSGIKIKTNNLNEKFLFLFDINGKEYFRGSMTESSEISTHMLSNGQYIVKIIDGNVIINKLVIILKN